MHQHTDMTFKATSTRIFLVMAILTLVSTNTKTTGNTGLPIIQNRSCQLQRTATGMTADCRYLGLTEVPKDLPVDVTELDVGHNDITTLYNDSFTRFPLLMILRATFNDMSQIEVAALYTVPNIQELVLNHNALWDLDDNLFLYTPKLQILDISYNLFSSLPSKALHPLYHLTIFQGGHNYINAIDVTGIKSSKLSLLDLSVNNISIIEQDNFYPLKDMRIAQFMLKGNKIKVLQDQVFMYLSDVTHFDLASNIIEEFSVMPFLGMVNLQTLSVAYNKISTIKPLSSQYKPNMYTSRLDIVQLHLEVNEIRTIPSYAFTGLDKLKTLDLHQSRVSDILDHAFVGLDSLEKLVLDNNIIENCPLESFRVLPSLQTLQLTNNRLTSVSQFSGIKTLKTLQLHINKIQKLDVESWNLSSLETLDLSCNNLPRLDINSFEGLQNLNSLSLSQNPITIIVNNAFNGADNLQNLDLSQLGPLGSFSTPFANLGLLKNLNLAGTTLNANSQTFTGLISLQELALKKASLTKDDLWDPKKNMSAFAMLQKLNTLLLSGNILDDMYSKTFANMTALTRLTLDDCDITYLHPDIFSTLTSLHYLFLHDNKIKTLDPHHFINLISLIGIKLQHNEITQIDTNLFSHKTRLSYVYLANNALSVITEGTALPKYFLDISGNPLSCVCQLQWFRMWIDKSNVTLLRPNQTVCSKTSLAGLQGKPLLSFDPKYECGPDVMLYIIIVFITLGLLLGVVMSYNKRWWLRYKLFHLKLLLIGYEEVEDARNHFDFRYDINIIFYDDDLEWVEQVLKPGIEEKLPDLNRFVCGDDDLPLGMYYMDAIIHVIENSYKTIVVVSEAAVTNHNFITKLRQVVENMNAEEVEKAVLVFVRDLPTNDLPYLVRLFLSENKPYIQWNEDMYGQQLFWDKLVKSISTNKKMNDRMPI